MLWDTMITKTSERPQYQPLPDEYDEDPYYEGTEEKTDTDMAWITAVAGLLGIAMVLESLKPAGPFEAPIFPEPPVTVSAIPEEIFTQVYSLDLNIETFSYSFNTKELEAYKQMAEEIKQHARLEDPKQIENIAARNTERINDMMGQYGNNEAYKAGALDTYMKSEMAVLIDWIPAGPNTCDDCLARAAEGPYPPHLYPEPQHYGDQCEMGDPVPVIIETS